jgi:predicted nucleic acid-binding protein
MYLIDTSIWINYFRQKNTPATQYFINLLDEEFPFGITGVIYQEVLQGAASNSDFNQLGEYLGTQRFYHLKDNLRSYHAAAKIYFDCRRKGITIRSTIDCIIAQIAIENDLILLHDDIDFFQISSIIKSLKIIEKIK